MSERGSVSLLMAVALGMAGILAAGLAEVSRAAGGRLRAQTAADAAALAAAQELVLPSGRLPAEVAAEYAGREGARVVRCRCTPGAREAVVTAAIDIRLLGRQRSVRATARAVVAAPIGSAGLQPWFAARLSCLFSKVSGLTVVSGYRTREQQARLHRLRPHLAAPPGHSLHERGLAADLGFAGAGGRRRAHRAAPSCGLDFPMSYEPWHVEPASSAPP